MRDCKKNQRKIWYSLYVGKKPILDEYGDETGDYSIGYENPVEIEISLSPGKGRISEEVFGANIDCSRTIMTTDTSIPIKESSLVWFETVPKYNADGTVNEQSADYEVSAPIADGLNVIVIALRKRAKNA